MLQEIAQTDRKRGARRGGGVKRRYWTAHERELLEANYSRLSREELVEMLPGRPWNMIVSRAGRQGLSRFPVADLHPIIARLVAQRQFLRLGQKRVAMRVGMFRSALSRYERGYAVPPLPVIERWATALHMRLSLCLMAEGNS